MIIVPMNDIDLCNRLKVIMVKHIGRPNAATRKTLFFKIYHVEFRMNLLEHEGAWERIKKAMSKLRKTSRCFIISAPSEIKGYEYFVIHTYEEFQKYRSRLVNTRKNLEESEKKALLAVRNIWFARPDKW